MAKASSEISHNIYWFQDIFKIAKCFVIVIGENKIILFHIRASTSKNIIYDEMIY